MKKRIIPKMGPDAWIPTGLDPLNYAQRRGEYQHGWEQLAIGLNLQTDLRHKMGGVGKETALSVMQDEANRLNADPIARARILYTQRLGEVILFECGIKETYLGTEQAVHNALIDAIQPPLDPRPPVISGSSPLLRPIMDRARQKVDAIYTP